MTVTSAFAPLSGADWTSRRQIRFPKFPTVRLPRARDLSPTPLTILPAEFSRKFSRFAFVVNDSIFKFGGGATPTLGAAAGESDDLFYTCISATRCDASLGGNFKRPSVARFCFSSSFRG
jgi:hypothetical protein